MGERAFAIVLTAQARSDLRVLKTFEARRVTSALTANLSHEPFVPSRNRKPLDGVESAFDYDPPLWELRVGELRVFYDGTTGSRAITVRAIRRKRPTQITQEILS